MSLAGNITLNVQITDTKAVGAESASASVARSYSWTWTDGSGTGSGVADKKWTSLARTLAGGASEDIDVSGSLEDAYGTVVFARISAIIIAAAAANPNNVQISNPAANGVMWTVAAADAVVIGPGGFMALVAPAAGYTVTASTADLIHVANAGSSGTVTYDIILVGKSA